MTLAAINWLDISINLLLVVFVIVCLLMTLLVLMQRPKQEGLGAAFGGGVTDQVFGARTTNVLQRGTVYLGSLFFILALALAILISYQNKQAKLLEEKSPVVEVEKKAEEVVVKPNEEVVPKSLVEELPVEQPAPVGTSTETTPLEIPAAPVPAEGSTDQPR